MRMVMSSGLTPYWSAASSIDSRWRTTASAASSETSRAAPSHAAAQLGHGSKEITKKHYIVKPALAPDSSGILEQLGASRAELSDHPDDGPRKAA